jgi:Activator of Hsp90 ATPase homolog 1-like protein
MNRRAASTDGQLSPLIKQVRVPCNPEQAFELFTERISEWWPLPTHSVGENQAVTVRLDGRVGGELVEHLADGRTDVWGTITEWRPPTVFAMTWHPGRVAEQATYVEVTFTPEDSSTLVTLTHSGWINRDDADAARHSYDSGWDLVLDRYVRHPALIA